MKLSKTQLAVLALASDGPITEMAFTMMGGDARTQKRLEELGLLRYFPCGGKVGCWKLTEAGRRILKQRAS